MVIHLMHAFGNKGALPVLTAYWLEAIWTVVPIRTILAPTGRSNLARYLPCRMLEGQPNSPVDGVMVILAVLRVAAIPPEMVVVAYFFDARPRGKPSVIICRRPWQW